MSNIFIVPEETTSEEVLRELRPNYSNFNRARRAARRLGLTKIEQIYINYHGMGNVKFTYNV